MTEFLEGLELLDRDGVADMEVGPGRVEALLDPEWFVPFEAPLELLLEVLLGDDLLGAAPDLIELFLDGWEDLRHSAPQRDLGRATSGIYRLIPEWESTQDIHRSILLSSDDHYRTPCSIPGLRRTSLVESLEQALPQEAIRLEESPTETKSRGLGPGRSITQSTLNMLRSEEHTSELQSRGHRGRRRLLDNKKTHHP